VAAWLEAGAVEAGSGRGAKGVDATLGGLDALNYEFYENLI